MKNYDSKTQSEYKTKDENCKRMRNKNRYTNRKIINIDEHII